MGNKILRQRLRGPALAAYYPPRLPNLNDLQKEFASLDLLTENEAEDDRLDHIQQLVPFSGSSLLPHSNSTQDESSWKGSPEEEEDATPSQYVHKYGPMDACSVDGR
jgi:small subunit ribosomal protein S33